MLLELLKAMDGSWNWPQVEPGHVGNSTGIEKGFLGVWNWEVKSPNIVNSAGLEKGLL